MNIIRTPNPAGDGQPQRRMVILRSRARGSTTRPASKGYDGTDLAEGALPAEADQPVVVRRGSPPPPGDPIRPAEAAADRLSGDGSKLDGESLSRKRQETTAVFALLTAALEEQPPDQR